MNKKIISIWEALFPLIIYYVILSYLSLALNNFTALGNYSKMLVQAITKAVCIPAMYYFYRNARHKSSVKSPVKDIILTIILGILFSISLNEIIGLTGVKELSSSYGKISSTIYSDYRIYQLLAAGILAPILEELTFRGILFGKLKIAFGKWVALIASSLIFGAFHHNLVQFIYATLIGIVFALIYDKTNSIVFAMLAHISANVLSLIITWFNPFGNMAAELWFIIVTSVVSLIAGIIILSKWRKV